MKSPWRFISLLLLLAMLSGGCNQSGTTEATSNGAPSRGNTPGATNGGKPLTIGVSFETLQTEFWVAGLDAIKAELKQRNIECVEAIADGDANRQLDQVKNFITQKVDGIIMVPKDAKACIPVIKAANEAKIPIALFNRPPDKSDAKSVAVVADNFSLTKRTVKYMIGQAKKTGKPHKAMIIIGDLGDINAIGRKDGFEAAVKGNPNINVVARVPSEWNQEKARAGVVNALQANPDISFIFTSSDFLFPSIVSALKAGDKYKKVGEPGHVILGGFDGDATAYQMLKDGYLDATGVQDVYFEARSCVQAVLDQRDGKKVADTIRDPGFVIHQTNLKEMSPKMWGANVGKKAKPSANVPVTNAELQMEPLSDGPALARRFSLRQFFFSEYLVLFLSLLYFLAVWPFAPRLGSAENLANILASMLPLLIVATGQTFVLITGGIDLSVTSVIALTSVIGAIVMNGDNGWLAGNLLAVPVALMVMLLSGMLVGAFNGLAITRLRMPPFIVTLTTMMFFSGFAIWLTQSNNISNLPDAFTIIGKNTGLTLLLTLLIGALAHLALSRMLFGRWLYATGQNARAALVSGVPVTGVIITAYVISGLSGAIASAMYTGRLETGSPVLGQKILLDVIGATVIGGTSLYGGKGKVLWTVFGVLFLTLIDNSLNLLNFSHFSIMMAKGAIILFAAMLDAVRNRL